MINCLFTVEQVELVRRIRQTGISLTDIAKIYETFDRLDEDITIKTQSSTAVGADAAEQMTHCPFKTSSPYMLANNNSLQSAYSKADSEASSPDSFGPADHLKTAGLWQMPFVSQASQLQQLIQLHRNGSSTGDYLITSVQQPPSQPPPPALSRLAERRMQLIELQTAEQQNELEGLKRRDEQEVIREIREFVAKTQLRQQTIALMTGISQPYVSKFLNGAAKELSERVRNLMFSWFVLYKSNPELISDIPTDMFNRIRPSHARERLPQRRERFAFKQLHIDLLEQYFKEEPYPNVYMRKEIATNCNHTLQLRQDGALSAKDLVTEHIVANWFSNRRKEKKRKGECVDLPRLRKRKLLYDEHMANSAVALTAYEPPEENGGASSSTSSSGGGGGTDAVDRIDPAAVDMCPTSSLVDLDQELEAVNNSVMALVDPYGQARENAAFHMDDRQEELNAEDLTPQPS